MTQPLPSPSLPSESVSSFPSLLRRAASSLASPPSNTELPFNCKRDRHFPEGLPWGGRRYGPSSLCSGLSGDMFQPGCNVVLCTEILPGELDSSCSHFRKPAQVTHVHWPVGTKRIKGVPSYRRMRGTRCNVMVREGTYTWVLHRITLLKSVGIFCQNGWTRENGYQIDGSSPTYPSIHPAFP